MSKEVFEIFLSSTSADLQPCRAKVRELIERFREMTIRMETFGARPARPFDTCRSEVQRCDALVVIVGHRYGWIPTEKDGGDGRRSITWFEVQWALEAGKPVYAYLVDDRAPWNGEREQDRLLKATDEHEFLEVGTAVQNLQNFRRFLEKETTRELFALPDDLAVKVAADLHSWLVEKVMESSRITYAEKVAGFSAFLPGGPPAVASGITRTFDEIDHLRWQEQIHLLSALRIAGGAEGVRIALLAGRANPAHPALSGASVRQFDLRRNHRSVRPDDRTTALAGLLVAGGRTTPYRGVAPGAELSVFQVVDENNMSSMADVLAALDAAIREGADVICLPLGSSQRSDVEQAVYREAAARGVVAVCAAGNESSNRRVYPGAYPDCICVGAVDGDGRVAEFSSFGEWVTTAAPGVAIPAAVGIDRFGRMSGTSFSCAIAAGTVALMRKADEKLTVGGVKAILSSVGRAAPSAAGRSLPDGTKVLDAGRAVDRARHGHAGAAPSAEAPRRGKKAAPRRR